MNGSGIFAYRYLSWAMIRLYIFDGGYSSIRRDFWDGFGRRIMDGVVHASV